MNSGKSRTIIQVWIWVVLLWLIMYLFPGDSVSSLTLSILLDISNQFGLKPKWIDPFDGCSGRFGARDRLMWWSDEVMSSMIVSAILHTWKRSSQITFKASDEMNVTFVGGRSDIILFFKVVKLFCGMLETASACFVLLQLRTNWDLLISAWQQLLSHAASALSTVCNNVLFCFLMDVQWYGSVFR